MPSKPDAHRKCTSESRQADYASLPDEPYDPLNPESVRNKMSEDGEMAFPSLCSQALRHASEGITHLPSKAFAFASMILSVNSQDWIDLRRNAGHVVEDLKTWLTANYIKAICMFLGLGITVYKAKTICLFMTDQAQYFIAWGRLATPPQRFLGFVMLMVVRLCVSTLVPPTSPAFGIIIQAATPETEKWTAMPFFLAASTVAGALPYLLDKVLQCLSGHDFLFTRLAKHFVESWPLTCWTSPTMTKVFFSVGGGKLGAALAVIFAHAAPFMGAQTTIMQRYFLPHPLDTIISQPFGMSEDLISMGMAEATSNPVLASVSLTMLIAGLNLAQFVAFSSCKDWQALASANLNVLVGLCFFGKLWQDPGRIGFALVKSASGRVEWIRAIGSIESSGLASVAVQLALQVLAIPMITCIFPSGTACKREKHKSFLEV